LTEVVALESSNRRNPNAQIRDRASVSRPDVLVERAGRYPAYHAAVAEEVGHREKNSVVTSTLLAEILESVGWQVVGPVARLATALDAAASEGFDAAVLDVNLGGQAVYPVPEVLDARRVPFVFVTAYGREALPPLFCGRPRLGKPFAPGELIGTVARLIAPAAEAEALLI
jgi:CheY-like chemotaxis protein